MIVSDGPSLRSHREDLGLSQAKLSEIAEIPQHLLSSFELGKGQLPNSAIMKLQKALADPDRLNGVLARKKRYTNHKYREAMRDPARVARSRRTKGNREYCALLNELEKQRTTTSRHAPAAVSLFSGCGGFSLGFAWAGFRIKGFVELDPHFRKIYQQNFPTTPELGGDITQITSADLASIAKTVGKIDVLIGGPPCQGFSLSGKRRVDDPRNTLFRHYLRFVDALKPAVAVMENVRLLTSMKSPEGGYVKDEIRAAFREHGYSVDYFEVNAKDYGVPQHRERVLFVAVRDDINIPPSLPAPSFGGDGGDLFGGLQPYRTFGDACSDLAFLESGESTSDDVLHQAVKHPQHVIDWLWNVPEGASAHDNDDPRMRPPSGYNTTYKRQVWTEPASTVQTTFGMISGCRNVHPIATRALTIREAARIQSFPDSFAFNGSLGSIRTSIGNALPPLMSYAMARHIRSRVLDFVKVSRL